MDIKQLWEDKSRSCSAFIGAVAAHNFNQEPAFEVLSDIKHQYLNPESLFQAASLSKLIAALVTALYLEQQHLPFTTPLAGKLAVEVNLQTTFRHLFSHSAGINIDGFPGYEAAPFPTLKQVIAGDPPANTAKISYSLPFGRFSYSGGGYCLAQEYIERVSGYKLSELAQKFLFTPLHLQHTTFEKQVNNPACVNGHQANGEIVTSGWHFYPETAAAGLWTTPIEYLQILQELIKAFYGESEIISQTVAKDILLPAVSFTEDGSYYQYASGVEILEDNIYCHSGNNAGYKCLFAFNLKERKAFVIMTNDDCAEKALDI